jgi:protein ImuB
VPVAVVADGASPRRLIGVNAAAADRGLVAGMPLQAALALVPELQALRRKPEAETQALEAVACWLYGFGAPVTVDAAACCVWVEIGGSLRRCGGWSGFARRFAEADAATELGFTRLPGIAPTLAAAALAARAGAGLARPILREGDIHSRIRGWPLALLPVEAPALALLHGAGLRRIGEVLALPEAALAQRCGPQLPLLLARLLGRAAEAWHAYEPPPQYRRRYELAGSVEHAEALLFPLRKMLGDFALYLRARDVAVQQFRLRFAGSGGRASGLDIGLLGPSRDAARLFAVVRERLEQLSLPGPVLELWLEAERFETAAAAQGGLFDGGAQQESFDILRERLLARLGGAAVRRLAVTADQRPEKTFIATWSAAADSPKEHPPRPPWLLFQPKPIAMPRLLGPPERIECGWWDGRHETRDYHLAEDASGRKLWVYRSLGSAQWHLHGLWQ